MRPKNRQRKSSTSSSPARDRSINSQNYQLRPSSPGRGATSVVERELVTSPDDYRISSPDYYYNNSSSSSANPRSFPHSVKLECWEKAEKVKGRDPERWRRDYLGNTIFRKLVGCAGCLCHDYDHVVPYSKGGKSTLENCQILQATVNRSKGNRTEISKADLIQKSSYCRVSGRDMDLLELSAYGNVRRGQDSGGCSIQ